MPAFEPFLYRTMAVFSFPCSRAFAADLHINPMWHRFTQAYRAYEMGASPDVLVYVQSPFPVALLTERFFLPRVEIVGMDRMLATLLDRPGFIGECVYMGGFFTRALRRPARNLDAAFDQVADHLQHEPPAPPASPVPVARVPLVVDLTMEPDTPDVVGPLRATRVDLSLECTSPPLPPCF